MIHQTTTEAITTIGIDLGKNTFHLIGMDARGRIVLHRRIARGFCNLDIPAKNDLCRRMPHPPQSPMSRETDLSESQHQMWC